MMIRPIGGVLAALLIYSTLALPATAQTSSWSTMTARSQLNNWDTNANMMLVADNTWQTEFFVTTANAQLKFHADLTKSGWVTDWGETNQMSFTPPFSGIAEKNPGYGKDIFISNMVPGCYRITFNDTSGVYRIDLLYTLASGVNIISNPSFEVQGSGTEQAYCWEMNNPDSHGGYWNTGGNGTPKRHSWRSHSGNYEATIEAQWWLGRDNYGGWWREGPATAGATYEGSAWFWADADPNNMWTCKQVELKIEFYSSSYGSALATYATNFTDIGQKWVKKTLRAEAPIDTAWARLVFASTGNGTQGALQVDDIQLRTIAVRNQDFNTWFLHTNDECNVLDDWIIYVGKATTNDARSGYCASIPHTASSTNYIRSTFLQDGLGSISFWYRHSHPDTNTLPTEPVSLLVQKSYDSNTWVTLDMITNILTTDYVEYHSYQYDPNPCYIRIVHHGGSTNRLLIDDISIAMPTAARRYQDFDEWTTYTNYDCYEYGNWVVCTGRVTSSNDALAGYSAELSSTPASNNVVRSPHFSSGIGTISFWYRRGTNNTSSVDFAVQISTNGTNWETLDTVPSGTNEDYQYYSHYMYDTRDLYMQIRHVSGTNTLLLDKIDVAEPVLHPSQNFDTWPKQNSYGTYQYQGWLVYSGMINSDKAYAGQVGRLKDTVSVHAYIQSPYLPDGIGTISFQFARYANGTPAVSNWVQTSKDGTNWTTIGNTTSTTVLYSAFAKYQNDTNSHYVRIYHQSGAYAQLIDEVEIGRPSPPPDVMVEAWHEPTSPYTNNTVKIWATGYAYYGATGLTFTTYYRIGTNGAFTAAGMDGSNQVTYVMTNSIPAQGSGTMVQYYVRCDFGGLGSESNSPTYYPEGGPTNPASYRIPRSLKGQVWINEINYLNTMDFFNDTNEFVELCGPAGQDISGWRVELYISVATNQFYYYGSYVLPDGSILPNDINGYGFYVLGDPELPAKDQVLIYTNEIDYTQISDGDYPSGVRLLNEGGDIEQSVSYRGLIDGFSLLPAAEDYSSDPDPYSIQLTGNGSNYTDFTWATNLYTPGSLNVGQSFGTNGPEPEVLIDGIIRGSSQLTLTMTATNGWWPEVWYTAALLPNPSSWTWISTRTITTNAGIWTLQFAYPAGVNNCFFRVEMSR